MTFGIGRRASITLLGGVAARGVPTHANLQGGAGCRYGSSTGRRRCRVVLLVVTVDVAHKPCRPSSTRRRYDGRRSELV